jgi:hypothetical protein
MHESWPSSSFMHVLVLFVGPERVSEHGQHAAGVVCPQSMATEEIKKRPVVIDVFGVAQH